MDREDDPRHVDAVGGRLLDQDPADGLVAVEPAHQLEQLLGGRVVGQAVVLGIDAHPLGVLLLQLDVLRRGRVATHQHRRQLGPRRAGGHARRDGEGHLVEDLLRDGLTVEDAGGHRPIVATVSGAMPSG
jgi:hypothetical protein